MDTGVNYWLGSTNGSLFCQAASVIPQHCLRCLLGGRLRVLCPTALIASFPRKQLTIGINLLRDPSRAFSVVFENSTQWVLYEAVAVRVVAGLERILDIRSQVRFGPWVVNPPGVSLYIIFG